MKLTAPLICSLVFVIWPRTDCVAGIVIIPDALDQTGAYSVNFTAFSPILGEDSVYISGRMTFDTFTQSSFDVVEINAGVSSTDYQWGNEFASPRFAFFSPAPIAAMDSVITNGESQLVVLKIDQTTGNYDVYYNPDLGLTEQANTPFLSRSGGLTGSISAVQFRGGLGGNARIVDYTGFRIHTGDDSPFSAVPEPSSANLLLLGVTACCFVRKKLRRTAS